MSASASSASGVALEARPTSSSRVAPSPQSFSARSIGGAARRRAPRDGRARCSCPGTEGRRRPRPCDRARPSPGRALRRAPARRRRPVPSVSMTMFSAPRPAPSRHSASAAAFPSFSTVAGHAEALAHHAAERDVLQRDVHRAERLAGRTVDHRRDPEPERGHAAVRQRLDRRGDPLEQLRLRAGRRPHLVTRSSTVPQRRSTPARIFVPPRSTPMTR